MVTLFGLLVVFHLLNSAHPYYTCLECVGVVLPSDCDKVKRCGDHEVCFIEIYINHVGGIRYDLGCRDGTICHSTSGGKRSVIDESDLNTNSRRLQVVGDTFKGTDKKQSIDIRDQTALTHSVQQPGKRNDQPVLVCAECCHGNLCNVVGCGQKGYGSRSSRGPVCYQCDQQSSIIDCDIVTVCGQDEICMLHDTSDVERRMLETKCESPEQCNKVMSVYENLNALMGNALIGKRYSHFVKTGDQCKVQCCSDDLCNVGCETADTTTSLHIPTKPTTATITTSIPPLSSSSVMPTKPRPVSTLSHSIAPVVTSLTTIVPLEACHSNPCIMGTCTDYKGTYYCTCVLGYYGLNCEHKAGFIFIPTTTVTTQTTMKDPCIPQPCLNGGACIGNGTKFTCQCASGFTGHDCSFVITTTSTTIQPTSPPDPCRSNPCVYGNCTSYSGTYTCTCITGVTGHDCSVMITTTPTTTITHKPTSPPDPCRSNPCVYGTCTVHSNGFECKCLPGVTGNDCSVLIPTPASSTLIPSTTSTAPTQASQVNPCRSNPCIYGNCTAHSGSYICHCDSGFSGKDCSNIITTTKTVQSISTLNPCRSNPCVYGSCTAHSDSYICQCAPGYNGKDCSLLITTQTTTTQKPTPPPNPCRSNPCYYGTCSPQTGTYVCDCFPGYAGQTCASELIITTVHTTVNPCHSNPCVAGNCIVDQGTFSCHCQPGYHGEFCDHTPPTITTPTVRPLTLNPCHSNPCVAGQCTVEQGIFFCHCPGGHYGEICEKVLTIPPTKAQSTTVNPCHFNPCLSGTCTADQGHFFCHCPEGYHGTLCEHKLTTISQTTSTQQTTLNPCHSNPCLLGTCSDANGTFQCHCPVGYYGVFCEHKQTTLPPITTNTPTTVNPCLPNPCLVGSCTVGRGRALCNCPPGYHGVICEYTHATITTTIDTFEIGPCSLQPCVFGHCNAWGDSYSCACFLGYSGKNCDVLKSGTDGHTETIDVLDCGVPGRRFDARGYAYYPGESQGGYLDMMDNNLHTLQDFLAGRASYVTVAMDSHAGILYDTPVCIPELNHKYGVLIDFRVRDTRIAYDYRKYSKISICVGSATDAQDSTILGHLTLVFK